MSARVCSVWLYVLKDVPDRFMPIIRALGFRPAKKSANWYRTYDNRLRGAVEERLSIETFASERAIPLDIRPVRSTKPRRPGKTTVPSAQAWLSRNDLKSHRQKRFPRPTAS